jgi:hypothetical protein
MLLLGSCIFTAAAAMLLLVVWGDAGTVCMNV